MVNNNDDWEDLPLEDNQVDDWQDTEQEAPGFLSRMLSSAQETVTPALETAQDFATGTAQGLSMGTMDELGGMIGAGIETGLGKLGIGPAAVDAQLKEQGFQVPEESFLQKYRGYQQASEKAQEESEARSPVANIAGQLAGGMTGGSILGSTLGVGTGAKNIKSITDIAKDSGKSKAALELLARGGKSYAQSLPLMIPELAATSKEQLIGENANPMGVAADVAGGMAFGLPAVLGLQAVSDVVVPNVSNKIEAVGNKISGAIDDSPLMRQAIHSFKHYGEELGISPRSNTALVEGIEGIEGGTQFSGLDTKRATETVKDLLTERSKLGELTKEALTNDNAKLIKIDASDLKAELESSIQKLELEMPTINDDKLSKSVLDLIKNRNYKDLSPKELKDTLDTITMYINKMSSYKIPSPEMQDTLDLLRPFRNAIDAKLKDAVSDYKVAANRFYEFNRAYLEQPLAGRFDPDTKDLYYSDLKNGQQSVIEAFEKLIQQTGFPSKSSMNQLAGLGNLKKATKAFEAQELARGLPGEPVRNASDFIKKIRQQADDSAVRQSVLQTQENTAGGKLGVLDALGFAPTGRGNINMVAQKLGQTKKALSGTWVGKATMSGADLSRKLYKAPEQYLRNLALQLESVPGLSSMGKALTESIENGSSYKKNAAILTIMQNPNAKLFINADDLKDEEE
jgi:hypothetical protein